MPQRYQADRPLGPVRIPALLTFLRALGAVIMDRDPARPLVAQSRRLPHARTLSDHIRRDIGFPPGAPFS